MSTNTKASNALVAVVDFYSGTVADMARQIDERDAMVRQLGAQLKTQPPPLPVRCEGLIIAARRARIQYDAKKQTLAKPLDEALHALFAELSKFDSIPAEQVDR